MISPHWKCSNIVPSGDNIAASLGRITTDESFTALIYYLFIIDINSFHLSERTREDKTPQKNLINPPVLEGLMMRSNSLLNWNRVHDYFKGHIVHNPFITHSVSSSNFTILWDFNVWEIKQITLMKWLFWGHFSVWITLAAYYFTITKHSETGLSVLCIGDFDNNIFRTVAEVEVWNYTSLQIQ